ncbi:hypothetical protein [Pantoea agglomerans]|nr:hypothetical protein [Pantoea agglomerans]MBD8234595.1 hypothetical protein [Pantoea agglomerans]
MKEKKSKLIKWEISEFKKEDFDNITFEELQELIDGITPSKNKEQE